MENDLKVCCKCTNYCLNINNKVLMEILIQREGCQIGETDLEEVVERVRANGIKPANINPWPRRSRLVTEYPESPPCKPPREVPNCSICQWKEGDCRPILFDIGHYEQIHTPFLQLFS